MRGDRKSLHEIMQGKWLKRYPGSKADMMRMRGQFDEGLREDDNVRAMQQQRNEADRALLASMRSQDGQKGVAGKLRKWPDWSGKQVGLLLPGEESGKVQNSQRQGVGCKHDAGQSEAES